MAKNMDLLKEYSSDFVQARTPEKWLSPFLYERGLPKSELSPFLYERGLLKSGLSPFLYQRGLLKKGLVRFGASADITPNKLRFIGI